MCRFIKNLPKEFADDGFDGACNLDTPDVALSLLISCFLVLQLLLYIVLAEMARRRLQDLPYGACPLLFTGFC